MRFTFLEALYKRQNSLTVTWLQNGILVFDEKQDIWGASVKYRHKVDPSYSQIRIWLWAMKYLIKGFLGNVQRRASMISFMGELETNADLKWEDYHHNNIHPFQRASCKKCLEQGKGVSNSPNNVFKSCYCRGKVWSGRTKSFWIQSCSSKIEQSLKEPKCRRNLTGIDLGNIWPSHRNYTTPKAGLIPTS